MPMIVVMQDARLPSDVAVQSNTLEPGSLTMHHIMPDRLRDKAAELVMHHRIIPDRLLNTAAELM